MCTVGGTKHGTAGCHRTYLSQRDLQSHVAHRHINRPEPRHQESVVGPMNQTESLRVHETSPGVIHQTMVASASQQHPLEFIASASSVSATQIQYNPSQPPPQIHDPGLIYHHPVQQQQQRPLEELRLQMAPPPPQGLPLSTLAPPMILSHGMKTLPTPLAIAQQVLNPPPRLAAVPAQGMAASHGIALHGLSQGHMPSGSTTHASEHFHAIPVMASRNTNLITVPIQDEGNFHRSELPRSVSYHDNSTLYQTQGGASAQSGQLYPPGSHSIPCAPQGSQVLYSAPPPGHAPQFISQAPPPPHHIIARPVGAPMGHPTSHPPPHAGPSVNIHSGPPPQRFPSPLHQYEEPHNSFGQPPGSNSPQVPWPPGAPSQRVSQRPQSSSGSMGPPHSLPFYQ